MLTIDSSHAGLHREGRVDTSSGLLWGGDTERIEPQSPQALRSNRVPDSEETEPLPSTTTNSHQILPSLRAIGLEPLVDGRVSSESSPHSRDRPELPPENAVVNTNPTASIVSMSSGSQDLTASVPRGQPSPAYADAPATDSTICSSTGRPFRRIFQDRELTSQSTDPRPYLSPQPLMNELDFNRAQPILPPLSSIANESSDGGIFKCEHPGCGAPAFQTQYLLK